MSVRFPDSFIFGASTAAYQIEGACDKDGRGESIWDRFSHTPGKVREDENGDIACDHYHRFDEDLDLIKQANMNVYRFSTSWARLFPNGDTEQNPKGFEFYDQIVNGCIARGIEPWICFYHWDLPQVLQDQGGWENRKIVDWYVAFAIAVARHFGDRVKHFILFNEPGVFVELGYHHGIHAPGIASVAAQGAAIHHVNLVTAEALRQVRKIAPNAKIGTVLAVTDFQPASASERDIAACAMMEAENVLAYSEPLFKGRYPPQIEPIVAPFIQDGDMATLCEPVDFLGVNHYSRMMVEADEAGNPSVVDIREVAPATLMRWEIWPRSLYNVLIRLHKLYGPLPIYICENGLASINEGMDYVKQLSDEIELRDDAGSIKDVDRMAYLHGYLSAAADAMAEGVDLRGYMIWTLLDNLEWALGYVMRFGLIEIEPETLNRRPKHSYHWYAQLAKTHILPDVLGELTSGTLPIRPVL
jgi:beta-glucosidase